MTSPLCIVEHIQELAAAGMQPPQIAKATDVSETEVAHVLKYGRLPSRLLDWSDWESGR